MVIPERSLPAETLRRAARLRLADGEGPCAAVIALIGAGQAVNACMHRAWSVLGLSDLKFGVLVTLFALDPARSTPADLAFHTGATRASVTDALDALQAQGWIERQRDGQDRRTVFVGLTLDGRLAAEEAVSLFLRTARGLGDGLTEADRAAFDRVCRTLRSRAFDALSHQPATPADESQHS